MDCMDSWWPLAVTMTITGKAPGFCPTEICWFLGHPSTAHQIIRILSFQKWMHPSMNCRSQKFWIMVKMKTPAAFYIKTTRYISWVQQPNQELSLKKYC